MSNDPITVSCEYGHGHSMYDMDDDPCPLCSKDAQDRQVARYLEEIDKEQQEHERMLEAMRPEFDALQRYEEARLHLGADPRTLEYWEQLENGMRDE